MSTMSNNLMKDGACSGRFPYDSDLVRIASKEGDVARDPLQGESLIQETNVRRATLRNILRSAKETKDSELCDV